MRTTVGAVAVHVAGASEIAVHVDANLLSKQGRSTMRIRSTAEFDNARGARPARHPGPPPARSSTCLPTTATGRSTIRPDPASTNRSCSRGSEASGSATDADPNGDHGRRLRYIIVVWFSICLFALVLLAYGFVDDAQWSESSSESDQDRRLQVTRTSFETG